MQADVCYTMRPLITIDQVDRNDVGTSLCLFVPDQIMSRFLGRNACGFLLRVSDASMRSCCYFSKPVVYITGLLSGVDRQSESAEISLSTYLPISNVFGAFLEEEKPSIKVLSLKPVSSYSKHSQ